MLVSGLEQHTTYICFLCFNIYDVALFGIAGNSTDRKSTIGLSVKPDSLLMDIDNVYLVGASNF